MKFNLWLKGLGAALLGGVISSIAAAAASGNLTGSSIKGAAIAGAALTAGAYLKQSPVPSPAPNSDKETLKSDII